MTLVFKIYPILDVKRNESGSLYKAACIKQGIEIKKKIYISLEQRRYTSIQTSFQGAWWANLTQE